jgi:leader peptidase (prepilin peptidase)/N-methyltransferase
MLIIADMLTVLVSAGLALAIVVNGLADNLPPDALGVRHGPGWPKCAYCGVRHSGLFALGLAGFLFKYGRCEHCAAPRRVRHVAVELAAAVLLPYLWQWAQAEWPRFLPAAVIGVTFILVAVIDIEHRLILQAISLPALALFAAAGAAAPGHGPLKTLWGGLAGFGITLGLFLLGQIFAAVAARRRGQPLEEIAFGGGDVSLGALMGLAVGWPGVLVALTVAVTAGGVFSLIYIVVQLARRRYNPYAAIAYGPFLIFGASLIYLYGKEFAAWYAGL